MSGGHPGGRARRPVSALRIRACRATLLVSLLCSGCAGTHSSAIATGGATAMSPPSRLVLCVRADQSRLPPAAMQPLIASFQEQLARKLSQDGTPVVVVQDDAAAAVTGPGSVLARIVLTDVRAGNQALRLVIGFGAGRAVLGIHTSLVDLRGPAPVELASWDTRSTTGALPGPVLGLIPPVAAGQAIGIVGGSAGLALGSRETLRREIDQSTTSIADQLLIQFQDRAWTMLAPPARTILQSPTLAAPRPL